jgi:predicted AlkP superfamily pyrophosphatase or phosphodiesterase
MLQKPIQAPLATLFIIVISFAAFAQGKTKDQQKAKPQPLTSRVILISISGLRADDLTSAQAARLRIPTLREMRANGAAALNVEGIYPSQTLPAHATIVSGLLPADHKVTANRAFDETSGMEAVEEPRLSSATDTLWDAARRAGLKTAAIGFPLTTGANIDFNSLAPPEAPQTRGIKLADLKQQDAEKARKAVETLKEKQPQLLLLFLDSYALAQRRFGLASPEASEALEDIDALLKSLLDAVAQSNGKDDTTFLLVSDAGLMKVEREFHPNAILRRKEFLKTDSTGKIVSWRAAAQTFGGSAAVFLHDPADEKTSREVEAAFREVHEQPNSPIWRIISRRDATKLGADPRAAFYLEAAPGYAMTATIESGSTAKAQAETGYAVQGYLPQRLEVRPVLIASGRGIKAKTNVEYARLVDVAPTVARLLAFEMRAARGHALTTMLEQTVQP